MSSEDDYDVQNEILDRKFTIYEVECAINQVQLGPRYEGQLNPHGGAYPP